MSYFNIPAMARDPHLRERIAACAATEGVSSPHPTEWADRHQWKLAASPGWGDAYDYAVNSGVENPGKDETVITDGMILAAVSTVLVGVH